MLLDEDQCGFDVLSDFPFFSWNIRCVLRRGHKGQHVFNSRHVLVAEIFIEFYENIGQQYRFERLGTSGVDVD